MQREYPYQDNGFLIVRLKKWEKTKDEGKNHYICRINRFIMKDFDTYWKEKAQKRHKKWAAKLLKVYEDSNSHNGSTCDSSV